MSCALAGEFFTTEPHQGSLKEASRIGKGKDTDSSLQPKEDKATDTLFFFKLRYI